MLAAKRPRIPIRRFVVRHCRSSSIRRLQSGGGLLSLFLLTEAAEKDESEAILGARELHRRQGYNLTMQENETRRKQAKLKGVFL